jgi:hypothetical protein
LNDDELELSSKIKERMQKKKVMRKRILNTEPIQSFASPRTMAELIPRGRHFRLQEEG